MASIVAVNRLLETYGNEFTFEPSTSNAFSGGYKSVNEQTNSCYSRTDKDGYDRVTKRSARSNRERSPVDG